MKKLIRTVAFVVLVLMPRPVGVEFHVSVRGPSGTFSLDGDVNMIAIEAIGNGDACGLHPRTEGEPDYPNQDAPN